MGEASAKADDFEYDVLISYFDRSDAARIRPLVERLENDGLKVWFDDRDVPPGVSPAQAFLKVHGRTRTLIVVFGEWHTGSTATDLEYQTCRFRDPSNPRLRLIPLYLRTRRADDKLASFAAIDWTRDTECGIPLAARSCRPGAMRPPAERRSIAGFMPGSTSLPAYRSRPTAPAVSGSNDGTVLVWDRDPLSADWTCAAVLEGQKSGVRALALSSDGQHAVSGSIDRTLRIWDFDPTTASWTAAGDLVGHTGNVWSVLLSSDGGRVISGSLDRTVRVWEARPRHTFVELRRRSQGAPGKRVERGAGRPTACSPFRARTTARSGSGSEIPRVQTGLALPCSKGTRQPSGASPWPAAAAAPSQARLTVPSGLGTRAHDGVLELRRRPGGAPGRRVERGAAGDGRRAVSSATSGGVRVWDHNPATASWTCSVVIKGQSGSQRGPAITETVAAPSRALRMARSGSGSCPDRLRAADPRGSDDYTNAKVLLTRR